MKTKLDIHDYSGTIFSCRVSVLEMCFVFLWFPSFKIAFLAGKHLGPVLVGRVLHQVGHKVGFKRTFEAVEPFRGPAHGLICPGRHVVGLGVLLVQENLRAVLVGRVTQQLCLGLGGERTLHARDVGARVAFHRVMGPEMFLQVFFHVGHVGA